MNKFKIIIIILIITIFTIPSFAAYERISGEDRYSTSVKISERTREKSRVVIISTGEDFADSLSGVGLSVALDAPILLTSKNFVPDIVLKEIKRLQASEIYILGGINAVSKSVESQLGAYSIKKLAGTNRTQTSEIIAREVLTKTDIQKIVVANSVAFADALSASAYLTKHKGVLLLTKKDSIDFNLDEWKNKSKEFVIMGGESVISESVKTRLNATRISGANRYLTSLEISKNIYPEVGTIIIADGTNFPDGLTAVSLSRKYNAAILLTNKKRLEREVYEYTKNAKKIFVVGGISSVSDYAANSATNWHFEPSEFEGSIKANYASGVNVRKTPGGEIIGGLSNNEVVNFFRSIKHSDGYIWYEIDYYGKKGFVRADVVNLIVKKDEGYTVPTSGTLRIYHDNLNVREKPWGKIITSVSDLSVYKFDMSKFDDYGNVWYRILTNRGSGWVYGAYTQIAPFKVTDVTGVFSSKRYTGDQIEIKTYTSGSIRSKTRVSIDEGNGFVKLGDFSDKNTFYYKPSSTGKVRMKIEAMDIQSSNVEHIITENVYIIPNEKKHRYINEFYNISLDNFATSQFNRSQISKGGYWVQASVAEIKKEIQPADKIFFDYKKPFNPENKIVISSTVNFREVPGGKWIASCYSGEVYNALDSKIYQNSIYYKINKNGTIGWIHGDYVNRYYLTSSQSVLPEYVKLKINSYIYNNSSLTGANIATVYKDEVYLMLKRQGNSILIEGNGKRGWLNRERIIATEQVNRDMYQFLDLRGSSGISVEVLNNLLIGKGILENKAAAFIEAGKKHNINEIYLVSHAILETGGGTSKLATGNIVSGTNTKVYNMYGIGAIDSNPINGGIATAYRYGWTTVDKAIIDGAKWISQGYVNHSSSQNTIYKMKYNYYEPSHQYATDVAWPRKQTGYIQELYSQIDNIEGYSMKFSLPQYKE